MWLGWILIIVGFLVLAAGLIATTPRTYGMVSGRPAPLAPLPTPPPQIAQTPRFCTSCGAALTSGAAFCPNCGATVSR